MDKIEVHSRDGLKLEGSESSVDSICCNLLSESSLMALRVKRA